MLRDKEYYSEAITSLLCKFDSSTLEAIYQALSGILREGKGNGLQKFTNRKDHAGR